MAPVRNIQIIHNKIAPGPIFGPIVPGETLVTKTDTIDVENVPLADGDVVVKTLVLGIDPWIRPRIRDPSIPGLPVTLVGTPISNYGLQRVIRSNNPDWPVGQLLSGLIPFTEYEVVTKAQLAGRTARDNKENIPLTNFATSVGLAGLTAYVGLYKICSPPINERAGQTALVSGASGGVGQVAGQICRMAGLKVVGLARGDEKCAWLKNEAKFDEVVDYKKFSKDDQEGLKKELLEKSGGQGFDVFFDNTGGPVLEAALDIMKDHGFIVMAGGASNFGSQGLTSAPVGIRNTYNLLRKQLTWKGFVVSSGLDLIPQFHATIPAAIARGDIKTLEEVHHSITDAEKAIINTIEMKMTGKPVILLSD